MKANDFLGVYTILDKKGERYDTPFFTLNDIMAERHFIMLIKDPKSIFGQFISDFELYHIANFSMLTGDILPLSDPQLIIEGKQIAKDFTHPQQMELPLTKKEEK